MITIEAPYPISSSIIILRDPEFQDSRAIDDSVNVKRAMDGTLYTTVKQANIVNNNETVRRLTFKYRFKLTREKALELEAFHRAYVHKQWRIIDFNDATIIGSCKTNPLNLQMDERATVGGSVESVNVEFEFCGILT